MCGISAIYGRDLKNGELRRKYDGIKYDVKKLDDLVFQLKMKDKI